MVWLRSWKRAHCPLDAGTSEPVPGLSELPMGACMVSVPTTGTTDGVGGACMVSGPNAGTADDADAAFPSGCGIACISIVGGLASTPGVS